MTPLKGREIAVGKIKDAVNASPYYRHLNMRLEEFSAKGCRIIMEMKVSHLSVYGRAHGGAIASLADAACGLALAAVIGKGEFIATQNLNIHYLLPVEKGTLTAEGRLVHRGSHTAILEADVFDQSGKKIAHAHTVHVIKDARRSRGGIGPRDIKSGATRPREKKQ